MSFPCQMVTLERILWTSHFMPSENLLPQDFCMFLEFSHSCGHPWLWNAISSELIDLDHESSCHPVTHVPIPYYIKLNVKVIHLLIFHIPVITKHVNQNYRFCLRISYDLGLFLKIALRLVEAKILHCATYIGEEIK